MGQTYNTNTSSFDQIVYRSSTYFGTAAYLQSKSNAQATSWEAVAASDVVNSVAKVTNNYVTSISVANIQQNWYYAPTPARLSLFVTSSTYKSYAQAEVSTSYTVGYINRNPEHENRQWFIYMQPSVPGASPGTFLWMKTSASYFTTDGAELNNMNLLIAMGRTLSRRKQDEDDFILNMDILKTIFVESTQIALSNPVIVSHTTSNFHNSANRTLPDVQFVPSPAPRNFGSCYIIANTGTSDTTYAGAIIPYACESKLSDLTQVYASEATTRRSGIVVQSYRTSYLSIDNAAFYTIVL